MSATYYRPLGATEQALWLRDRAVPLHFALTAQVRGTLLPQRLTQALERLQTQHPLLRAKIELDQNQHPWFAEDRCSIPCRVLQRQGDQHWQEEVIRELEQPFIWTKAPLMRVVLLQSASISELIIVCHHAIADGLSAVNLIQELLNNLDAKRSIRPVPPSLESLLPKLPSVSKLQTLLARGVLKLKQLSQQSQSRSQAPLKLSSGTLSPTITTELVQHCRQEETTVHSAICTALLFVLALSEGTASQTLKCFSPVNVRPYLRSHLEQDCGLYIAPARTTHAIAPNSQFWEVARSLKANLMTQANENHLHKVAQQTELLMTTNISPEQLQQVFVEQYASDIMVTNLGRLSIPQQFGDLILEAIYGSAVLSGFATERVLGINTWNDRLSFTFVHQPNSETAPDLAEQAMKLIKTAMTVQNFTLSTARESLLETSIEYALKY